MVVLTKQQCKDRFSERLNEAVEKAWDVTKEQRPHTALVRERLDIKISYEAVRKWLSAESIPDMTHVSLICAVLEISPTWLLTGNGPMLIADEVQIKDHRNAVSINQSSLFPPELRERYDKLGRDDKIRVQETVRNRIGELEANLKRKKSRG